MNTVVRYAVRNSKHQTLTLCETQEQAAWMAFLLGRGHYFGSVTDRRLLGWMQEMERWRDMGGT